MSGTQIFVSLLCGLAVVGSVLIAWAKAFAARKTGQWPDED